MPGRRKSESRQEAEVKFILAARELIETGGIANASVRNIASRTEYHNSTIYAYFEDVDYLLSLACIPFLSEYSQRLEELSRSDLSTYDGFFAVWRYFCRYAFQQPEVFHHFYFGKYANRLTELLDHYFTLFPEEQAIYSQSLSGLYYMEMFYGNSIEERSLCVLRPLIDDPKTRLTENNLALVNQMTIFIFRNLLEDRLNTPDSDGEDLVQSFLQCLHYLVDQ